MKRLLACALAVGCCLGTLSSSFAQYVPSGCLSDDEQQLSDLVNQYRIDNGKAAVPLSQTLLLVGQWHVADHNYAEEVTGEYGSDPQCNLHTWYGIPDAPYSTCCYTADHGQAQCMWVKPAEISNGQYSGTGYEAAAAGYTTVEAALDGWRNSPGHNDFILSNGTWPEWTAMGVGVDIESRRYFLWLSDVTDPVAAEPCEPASVDSKPESLLAMGSSHPNPFRSQVSVSYRLERPGSVRAVVLNAGGRIVRTFEGARREAGNHELMWDGTDEAGRVLSNGLYFVRVWADGEARTSKVALLRR